MLQASNVGYQRWRNELAATGLVVVGVEFEMSGSSGCSPVPRRINDCAAAAQWTIANSEQLGISKVVISGESGGGNLSIATALRLKKKGGLTGSQACTHNVHIYRISTMTRQKNSYHSSRTITIC